MSAALPRAISASSLPSDGFVSGSVSPRCAMARQMTSRSNDVVAGIRASGIGCLHGVFARRRRRDDCRHHSDRDACVLFLLKRLATFVATLLVGLGGGLPVLELLPGNAAQMMLGDTATPEAVRALDAKLGLDRPPLERYRDWVGGMLQRRHRPEPRLQLAGRRADRRAAAGHRAAGADGDGADDRARARARRLRRVAPQQARRRRPDGPVASSASRSRTSGSRSC